MLNKSDSKHGGKLNKWVGGTNAAVFVAATVCSRDKCQISWQAASENISSWHSKYVSMKNVL